MTKAKKFDEDGLPAKRNRRSRKDPRAPKRSKSAYIFFAIENRESVKAEIGPDARVGDIAKLTSRRWKTLTDGQRVHWENVARADRDRYQEEKAAYTGPLLIPPAEGKLSDRKSFKKKPEKDPSAPKRPITAFLYFSQQLRPSLKNQNPGWRMAELSQELGRMWREMSESERTPYLKYEEEVKEKWRLERANYKEKLSILANQRKAEEKKEQLVQQQQKKLHKPPAKKEKPQQPHRNHYEEDPQRMQRHHVDQHNPYNMYDMYRQQPTAANHMSREDGYMGMGGQYPGGSSAMPGMLSQHRDAHATMGGGGGYPSVPPGGNPAYQQAHHQQASYYGEHGAASGRYADAGSASGGPMGMGMPQGMDMRGYSSSAMMGGDMSGMGMYGYGAPGMMMDPAAGYGYMGGM